MGTSRATTQDIRPLRIVVLNLMPIKITTETDLIRVLSNTPLQLELTFMKIKSHTSKNTPVEHMRAFYHDFEVLRNQKFDGLIITGAPVEHLEFEDVNYWDEMQETSVGHAPTLPPHSISAGQPKQDCTITTAFPNIRYLRRNSAFSHR